MIAGTLEIQMMASMAKLSNDLRQANDAVSGFGRQTEQTLAGVKRAFGALGIGISIGAVVAAFRSAVNAAREFEESALRLDATLKATGHSIGITRKRLDEMADAMQRATGFNDEDIRRGQAEFVKFGNIQKQVYERGMKLSADYAAFTSSDFRSAAQAIGKALQSPTEGVTMLERQIGKLTFTQKEQIKTLMEQGRLLEAQGVVLDILQGKVGGTAEAMNSGLNGAIKNVVNSWGDLLETIGKLPKMNSGVEGLASLLTDIRLTIEGTRNPLSELLLDLASFLDKIPTTMLIADMIGRSLASGGAKSGQIRNPFAEQGALDQAAAIARLQAVIDAASERTADKAKTSSTAAAAAAKAEAAAYESVRKAISEKIAVTEAEIASAEKLSDIEAMVLKIRVDLRDGALKLTQAHRIQLGLDIERLLALDKGLKLRAQEVTLLRAAAAAVEALDAIQEQANRINVEFNKTQAETLKQLAQETELYKLDIAVAQTFGLTNAELTQRMLEHNNARDTSIALRKLEQEFQTASIKLAGEEADAYKLRMDQLIAWRDAQRTALAVAIPERNAAKSAIDSAQRADQEFRSMWESVDRTAHDTFVNIFDQGANVFERLTNTLKSTLLDLLYQMTVKKWVFQIFASVTGGAAGVAGMTGNAIAGTGGAGGLFNLASTGNSLYNALSGNSSSLLNSIGSALGIGGASGAAAGTFGALAGAGAVGAPIAGGAASLLGSGIPGAFGSSVAFGAAPAAGGAMAGLAAAAPYIAAAVAIASALGIFGSKKSPAVGTGYNFSGDFTAGSGVSNFLGKGNFTAGSKSGFDVLSSQDVHIQRFNTSIGKAVAEFSSLADKLFGASVAGKKASFDFTTPGIGQAQEDAAHPVIALQVVGKLAAEIIPDLEAFAKDGEEAIQTFIRLGAELQLTDEIAELLGADVTEAFGGIGVASLKMRDELVQLMGGLEQATALTSAYYQNFFSDSERFAIDLDRVNRAMAELGIATLPATRAEFRALVEAQDLSTRAGKEMFAALMQLAPAFAAVTEALDDLAAMADTTAGRLARANQSALELVDAQIRASEKAGDAARRNAEAYRRAAQALSDASVQLRGGALSPLLPGQKLAESRALVESMFGAAQGGDMEALNRLPEAATAFLEASRAFNASSPAYTADFERVMSLLARAGVSATGGAMVQDYQATLLEIQTDVLEDIKGELEKASPSVEILREHTALLATIRAALSDQTGLVLTGNVTQDAIRTLTGLNSNLSEEMLTALIRGTVTQDDQFASMLTGIGEMVALLQEIATLTDLRTAEEQAAAQSRAAEQAARAVAAAEAQRAAAEERATAEAAAAVSRASTSSAQASSSLSFVEWMAKHYPSFTPTGSEAGAWRSEDGRLSPGAISELMNQWGISPHAMGGVASGWSLVGEQGPELANFTSPARIYTADQTRAAMSGGSGITKADIAELKAEIAKGNELLVRMSDRSSRDVKEQTGELKDGLQKQGRDIVNGVAGATEVRVRA